MKEFIELDLPEMPTRERHQLLLSAIAPRPIALTGTMDRMGRTNLSPFSFFNVFGANPAYIAISPALHGKDGAPKHTYLNILEMQEFTVSIVNHAIVEQASLASGRFSEGVDEFVKAGFTKKASKRIVPPGVLESPCILECKLFKHIELGGKPSSGNLLLAEVVYMHVKKDVLDTGGAINPFKMDQVARLGQEWYSRAREGIFELPKPPSEGAGVGFDRLPVAIIKSPVLTGSDLARLAGVLEIPQSSVIGEGVFKDALAHSERRLHELIQEYLHHGQIHAAWEGVRFIARREDV